LRHLIKKPQASLDELMRFVPGPDLPTGGRIVGLEGIREAYETGNGSFRIQASTRIENVTPRRKGIVITELPFNVGPEKIIEAVKKLVVSKKIEGIADLKNLTDRKNGLKIVIEIKNGYVPEAVLAKLYRSTPLESSFSINSVALVDGQPRTLTLIDMLRVFLEHRIDVVRRRSVFRRDKALDRLHLVSGLLIAIVDIDEVIQLIRSSDDRAEARSRLMSVFDLSLSQTDYILDLQLGRLTKFSRIELEKEAESLRATIDELNGLLNDEIALKELVSQELAAVSKDFGTPRRTVLLEASGAMTTTANVALEVADDPCWVLLSTTGLVARTGTQEPFGALQARGLHDSVSHVVAATARGQVGVIDEFGVIHRLDVIDLPVLPATAEAPRLGGGIALSDLLPSVERPLALVPLLETGLGLALATKSGVVKRVKPDVLNKESWPLINLDDGDLVVGANAVHSDNDELVFITSDAQLLHFNAGLVRPQGRDGKGIAGIKLSAGNNVISFNVITRFEAAHIVTVAGMSQALTLGMGGSVKVSPLSIYPSKGRATGGVRCQRFLSGEDALTFAACVDGVPLAANDAGSPVELPQVSDRRDGSGQPLDGQIHGVATALDTESIE
ncbi:MAG: DNA topoisomerase IV, partial [Aeromicrobium sp.]